VDIVDIRVSLVCVLVCSDEEEEMASPDVDLGRTWSVGHVGLKVDETCVDFVGQQHTFGTVEISLRNNMLLVVVNSTLELANSVSILARLSKDQSYEIEHHRVRFGTLIETLIKILKRSIKIPQSIVKQTSDHIQRRVVFNRLHLLYRPHS
jgi:hypothetical protein